MRPWRRVIFIKLVARLPDGGGGGNNMSEKRGVREERRHGSSGSGFSLGDSKFRQEFSRGNGIPGYSVEQSISHFRFHFRRIFPVSVSFPTRIVFRFVVSCIYGNEIAGYFVTVFIPALK